MGKAPDAAEKASESLPVSAFGPVSEFLASAGLHLCRGPLGPHCSPSYSRRTQPL